MGSFFTKHDCDVGHNFNYFYEIKANDIDGKEIELESIEIYWIGDCGRIVRCHTYFNPSEDQVLDPWFTPGWNEED